MSSNSYPVLFNSQLLDTTVSTLYTVPSNVTNQSLQDCQLMVTNTDASPQTVTLYAVPSGGSAGADNAIVLAHTVPANDYTLIPVERLVAGGTIQGLAGNASVVSVKPITGKLHAP